MFALLFEDSNCADCCGFMSAFIRQCWICHYIINILNNVIKLLEAPLPVCFDPSYEKEHGAAFGADFISIKSCFVYLFYLSYFPPVYMSILAISTLCLFSINAALKKKKKKRSFLCDSVCLYRRYIKRSGRCYHLPSGSEQSKWHLLPKHQTYKHSVLTACSLYAKS